MVVGVDMAVNVAGAPLHVSVLDSGVTVIVGHCARAKPEKTSVRIKE